MPVGLCEKGKSMSSLPGCVSLDAATAAPDSEDMTELQQAVVEELGISMEELRQFIDEMLEKMDCIQQRKKQLAELETWSLQKESEVAYVDQLLDDASRAVINCESLVKDFYSKLGLRYHHCSSEDEASQPTEIIEIPDEDDDVLSIDSGMYIYHVYSVCAQYPQRPDEDIGSPETGVLPGCELPCGYWNSSCVFWKSSWFSQLRSHLPSLLLPEVMLEADRQKTSSVKLWLP